jgi:hypothetical protein
MGSDVVILAHEPRPRIMRARAVSLLTILLLAAFGFTGAPSDRATAACAAASVSVEQTRVTAGDELIIVGRDWSAECNDSCGPVSGGCVRNGGCVIPPDPPIHGISIMLDRVRSAEVVLLADGIAADEHLGFRAVATIPEDTQPGRYRLLAEGGGIEGTTADGSRAVVIKVVAAPNA